MKKLNINVTICAKAGTQLLYSSVGAWIDFSASLFYFHCNKFTYK